MSTASEVKAGLDDIAAAIRAERQALKNAKARVSAAKNGLNGLPTAFADVIATVQGYSGADEFETQAAAELSRLTTEFQSLKTKATAAETALASIDFTT